MRESKDDDPGAGRDPELAATFHIDYDDVGKDQFIAGRELLRKWAGVPERLP
jgi:hypothetical protein